MNRLRRFSASVALLALLAGPALACCMAQAAPGHNLGACPEQKSHECENALSAAPASCCTISAQENPYLAVRASLPAAAWTPEADGVFAAALQFENEERSLAGNGGTFSPLGSPPTTISVLRI